MKTLNEKRTERITNFFMNLGLSKELATESAIAQMEREDNSFNQKINKTQTNEHHTLYDGTQVR
jgi:hypothetical protein